MRLALITALLLLSPAVPAAAQQSGGAPMRAYTCGADDPGLKDNAGEAWLAAFESSLPLDEVEKQWSAYVRSRWPNVGEHGCAQRNSLSEGIQKNDAHIAKYPSVRFQKVSFSPSGEGEIQTRRERQKVFFRTPDRHGREWGYPSASFEIEYQLIPCFGELHLAYSVVENSVRQGGRPAYFYEGKYVPVSPINPQITSVPITGTVYVKPYTGEAIGRFADDAAGKSLGFGCFSGQTKKVGNIRQLVGEKADKAAIQKFIDSLGVSFKTNELRASTAAEAEALRYLKGDAETLPESAYKDEVKGELDSAARRHAEVVARNAAAQEKYEKELAAQQAAVAKYNAEVERVAAVKAAQEAQARAVREDHARKMAAHQAEVERARQAQAAYEAQFGKGTVSLPAR